MKFVLGYEKGKLVYTFKGQGEKFDLMINTFRRLGVDIKEVTAAQFAAAERQQEKDIWG